MIEINRRDIILGATGAALLFGLDRPVAFIGAAQAQRAADSFKYKVGDIEAFSLLEGFAPRKLDASFVRNASLDEVKAALAAGGMEETFQNPFTVTAVRTGGKTVLFDSGFGDNGAPTVGKMAGNMKAAGLDPAKVDTLIVSHFHGDHISGLWAKETSAPIYPNAEILMPEAEFKHWTDPALVEKVPEGLKAHVRRIQATFPTWKNVRQYKDGDELAPGIRAVASYGHTPGHTSHIVASGSQQLLVLGDAATLPALFVRNPGWHVMFDGNGPQAEATRRKLFDRVIADKAMIAGYHFGFPNVGTLAKDGNSYAFTAVKA